MPSARAPPPGLGIATRLTGLGRYVPAKTPARILGQWCLRYSTVWSMAIASIPAAPLLAFTRFIALSRFCLVIACSKSPDPVPSVSYPILAHRLTVYVPRLLSRFGHPHAVALRYARRDQLATGLAPVGVRPCWTHNKKPRQGGVFSGLKIRKGITAFAIA